MRGCATQEGICARNGIMLSNALVLTVGGPGDRPVPGCRPAENPRGRNTRTPGEAQPHRPPRPAVWELPGRLGMSWNGPARRSYGNAADRHLPPSRGRPNQGFHSLPEEVQPGTVPRPPPRYSPGLPAPACPGGVLMKKTPHHSGEHGRPQRPRTHRSAEIPACPGNSPLRRNAEVCACGAQRLVDQEGKPRRHLVRDETGAIREPRRPRRLDHRDHPDHPGRVPLHLASRTRRRFRQVRGPAPAGPGGDMDRQVNRPIFT